MREWSSERERKRNGGSRGRAGEEEQVPSQFDTEEEIGRAGRAAWMS